MRVKIALALLLSIVLVKVALSSTQEVAENWVVVSGRVVGAMNPQFLKDAYAKLGYNFMGAMVGNAAGRQNLSDRLDNALLQLRANNPYEFDRILAEQGLRFQPLQ